MVEVKCIVQGLSVGCKKMQNVVLSIFEVSEHDNQPELEHELLPQYVIDTREHDGNVCFFRNDILQYRTATQNMSSAEDRGRIDTSPCNRILSKSKILLVLYSCEELSIIYIIYQSTYFIEYFMQGNFKYPRIKKIYQVPKKITRFDRKVKILCVL